MPTHARLSYLLRQVQLAVYQQLDAVLREFGLTPTQYMVLGIFEHGKEGLSSAALARRLGVTPQSANEIIVSLAAQLLVSRKEDADNRRIRQVQLTGKGRALLARCDEAVDRFEGAFYAGLSSEERAMLRKIFTSLLLDSRKQNATASLVAFSPRAKRGAL
jgi:DNA-binding MarR family transcriptional regulator